MIQPTMEAQLQFWTEWVKRSTAGGVHRGNEHCGTYVLEVVRATARPDMKIPGRGCGTVWLSAQLAGLGAVTAVDLPARTIENLKLRRPDIPWLSGDFLEPELKPNERFDVSASVEVIVDVPIQHRFVRKIADLIIPRVTAMTATTQNPPIWNRTQAFTPPKPGRTRNWPSRLRLRQLCEPCFALRRLRTCAPNGARGSLRLRHNRIIESVAPRLFRRNCGIPRRNGSDWMQPSPSRCSNPMCQVSDVPSQESCPGLQKWQIKRTRPDEGRANTVQRRIFAPFWERRP